MSLADLAAANGLHRVGARAPLGSYLKQTWQRRDFIYEMAKTRLQAGVERNRLGPLWLVLQPVLNAAIYGLIFGVIQGGARGADYPAYVVIGVFLFQFFSKSFSDGSKSITGNHGLVQSLAFPRITLPIAEVVEQFMALMPSLGLLAIILPFMGHPPTWEWLLMIPLLAIFSVFNVGVALISARLTVHVRDLSQLLPYISRILFYTSGVLFDVGRILKDHPSLVRLYDFHPLYGVLQIARSVLLVDRPDLPTYWWTLAGWAVVVLVVGLIFFWSAEERYGRD